MNYLTILLDLYVNPHIQLYALGRSLIWKKSIMPLSILVAQMVKNLPAMQETQVWSLGREDPWRREWLSTPILLPREFHGQRSQSRGSQRVGYKWVTNTFTLFTLTWKKKINHALRYLLIGIWQCREIWVINIKLPKDTPPPYTYSLSSTNPTPRISDPLSLLP